MPLTNRGRGYIAKTGCRADVGEANVFANDNCALPH
jgi:hypothetical protein